MEHTLHVAHVSGELDELRRLRELVWIQLVACVERARPLHLAYRLAAPLARVVEENRAPAARVSRRNGAMVPWLRERRDVLVEAHVGLAQVMDRLNRLGTTHVVAARRLPDLSTARVYRAAEQFVAAAASSHRIGVARRSIAEAEAQLVAVDVFLGWR